MNILQEQQQTASYISRILTAFKTSEGAIKPHFVITGNSGTGKSFLVSKLAAENKLDIIHVNAAQVTQEGVSGNSLSKVLSPLADTEGRLTVVFIDEFDKWFTPDSKGSINAATTAILGAMYKAVTQTTHYITVRDKALGDISANFTNEIPHPYSMGRWLSYAELPENLKKEFKELIKEDNDHNAYVAEVMANLDVTLNSCTTVKKLRELWVNGSEIIDKALGQSQQSPTVHMPMVAIQTLDALVPLP